MTDHERNKIIQELRNPDTEKPISSELLNLYVILKSGERMIPTGCGETHVYVYYPITEKRILPVYINIHGGGFVKGHRQQDVLFSRNICNRAECVVVDIDYATAPEQKYPYAVNQCYDVVKWIYDNPQELGIDKDKIAVGGHSAGGTCTAALTLMANQTNEFKVKMQILDYPCLDVHTPPELKPNAYASKQLLPDKMRLYNDLYIDPNQSLEPTASPTFAPDEMLRGLPEALIMTCADDALGDEAQKYAYRLILAGVPVTVRRFLNSHHGFTVKRTGEYRQSEQMILDALQKAFR